MIAAAMLAVASWSCSDDDTVPAPLGTTDLTSGEATYNSLIFTWSPVTGARQYSYQLTESESGDVVNTGVTKETSATFTGLTHDTEYTLTVLSYAAMGSGNTTSEPVVLTARTADLTTLGKPQPVLTREVNTIIISWNAIDGARDYAFRLADSDGNILDESTTFSTSVQLPDLSTGSYIFSVTAQTETEGFRNSETAVINFDFTREREEIWRTPGTYSSALLGTSWDAELVAYDDNSYVLLAWYGVADYDFRFSIDENNAADMFQPDASYNYNASAGSYTVPTGLAEPANLEVNASGNRCAFEGSAGSGSIVINVSDGTDTVNDTFRWGVSIDDFVGTWNCEFVAYDNSSSDYDETYASAVEITLGEEENTLVIPLPNYYGYLGGTGVITVDLSSMTFTMQPTPIGDSGFIFAGTESETTPLTGKISTTGIIFDSIQTWYNYDGYFYYYLTSDSYLRYTR